MSCGGVPQGDRDPKMKERSNTRNSIMCQYGKVLPRAQRKLAIERAQPYQHPSTVLKEGIHTSSSQTKLLPELQLTYEWNVIVFTSCYSSEATAIVHRS